MYRSFWLNFFIRLKGLIALFIISQWAVPALAQSPAWLDRIQRDDDFFTISIRESTRSDMQRATKFLAPANKSPELLHTVYQNVNLYRLHIDFMRQEFPQYFAGLSSEEYLDLVYYRASRVYYAGVIYQFANRDGNRIYGFNIYHAPGEHFTIEEARLLYDRLSESFALRPLAYSPITNDEIQNARLWKDPGFPVYLPEGLVEPEYEVYSAQTNIGRVRLFTLDQFDYALSNGRIGWQDIVVIDQAPTDIETVVAGIVTGTRQGELSHVNVRALRRKTPNAYVQNPLQAFRVYEDQLVKLILTQDGYQVIPNITVEEAETWWSEHRPSLPPLPPTDDETARMLMIDPSQRQIQPAEYITAYGGKAGNLAVAYEFLDPQYRVEGFAIPFRYYCEFMRSNTIRNPYDLSTFVTYEECLSLYMRDELFRGDSAYRRYRLESFIEYARENGQVDTDLVARILDTIEQVFGSTSIRVRFRSSSNTEDSLLFNGAGLYDSTTVCPEDNLDQDDKGPSQCDPNEKNEKTIERGLKKVWMSLWNPKAYEEREFYQIDHHRVRMGVLVTRAFPDEDANGVAFTGDPNTGYKHHFVVNVQLGDESVVQPGAGIVPEKNLVTVYPGGAFIQRVRPSSLMPDGEWVLTDDQLTELGNVLQIIDQRMPLSDSLYQRKDVLMDVEFKFDEGQLFVKQVRPTLSPTAQPIEELPDVKLIIPDNAVLAAVFMDGRSLQDEYSLLSLLRFKPGEYTLPTRVSELEMNLIESIEYTPERIVLTPTTNGIMSVEIYEIGGPIPRAVGPEMLQSGERSIQFIYKQRFLLPDGQQLDVTLSNLQTFYDPAGGELPDFVLTEDFISSRFLYADAMPSGGDYNRAIRFASITYQTLPLYKHTVEFDDGNALELYRRHQPPFAGSGPANLVYAVARYQGRVIHQSDYWKLVYAAVHHNWDEKFRVLFDAPIGSVMGIDVETFTFDQKTPAVYLLDANLNRIQELPVRQYTVEEVDRLPDTPVPDWWLY